jgi:ribosome-binding protein aMBF1 (putative translation factor)
MQIETFSRWRRIQSEQRKRGQGNGVGFFVALADSDLEVLREFLEEVDPICREVWTTQGNLLTAEFVRVVLVQTILNTIEARVGTIKSRVEMAARRKRSTESTTALRHLAQAVGQLRGIVSERYEIEARELAHQNTSTVLAFAETANGAKKEMTVFDGLDNLKKGIAARKVRIEQIARSLSRPGANPASSWAYRLIEEKQYQEMALDELVQELGRRQAQVTNVGEPARRISQAPSPPTSVGGLGLSRTGPKSTQIPPDLPPHYPNDLKPQTHLIIAEAVKKFSDQTCALELCKCVISDLTPHLLAAVQDKTLRPDLVVTNMDELLHYLLVSNCDDENERFRLKQEARKSDEWLALVRVIADAAKEQSDVKSRTSSVAKRLGQNIDRLRKECGWSFDKLADMTGIDKKQILSHVNKGTKPQPRILKEYAQAFTRELDRKITAADLEE